MKKCTNCNKEYDDSKLFCPECGVSLTPNVSSGISGTASSVSGMDLNAVKQSEPVPTQESPWYSRWIGTIISVIGLLIEWNISALIGTAVIIVGFLLVKKSSNSKDKAITIVFLVTGILLFLITALA